MMLSIHQQQFSQDIAKLIFFANSLGVNLTFGDAYRSDYQQKEYVRTGKSKTMNSNHLRRLAVDFNFFINGRLYYHHHLINKIGMYWESLGSLNRWGGNFSNIDDTPHFERNV